MAAGEEKPLEYRELVKAIEEAYDAFYKAVCTALNGGHELGKIKRTLHPLYLAIADTCNLYIKDYYRQYGEGIMSPALQQVCSHLFDDSPVEGMYVPGYPNLILRERQGPIIKDFLDKFFTKSEKEGQDQTEDDIFFWQIMTCETLGPPRFLRKPDSPETYNTCISIYYL